jgi:hypothetical protein
VLKLHLAVLSQLFPQQLQVDSHLLCQSPALVLQLPLAVSADRQLRLVLGVLLLLRHLLLLELEGLLRHLLLLCFSTMAPLRHERVELSARGAAPPRPGTASL